MYLDVYTLHTFKFILCSTYQSHKYLFIPQTYVGHLSYDWWHMNAECGGLCPISFAFHSVSEVNVPDIFPFFLMKKSLEVESPSARRPRAFAF